MVDCLSRGFCSDVDEEEQSQMAEFLTTQGTAYYVEHIIINANNWLVLVSPYLNLTTNFHERLQDADRRNVKTMIIYGKDELKPEEKRKLQELKNLSLHFCKDLHAKCFLNEECMVITSMNMYAYSEKKNREMGVLVRKENEDDEKVYNDALREVKSILDSSKEEQITKVVKPSSLPTPGQKDFSRPSRANKTAYSSPPEAKQKSGSGTGAWAEVWKALATMSADKAKRSRPSNKAQRGHCIRCGTEIPHDLGRPYCRECYSKWQQFENLDYKERYCHTCGRPDGTKMLYPQCRSCFKKTLR